MSITFQHKTDLTNGQRFTSLLTYIIFAKSGKMIYIQCQNQEKKNYHKNRTFSTYCLYIAKHAKPLRSKANIPPRETIYIKSAIGRRTWNYHPDISLQPDGFSFYSTKSTLNRKLNVMRDHTQLSQLLNFFQALFSHLPKLCTHLRWSLVSILKTLSRSSSIWCFIYSLE